MRIAKVCFMAGLLVCGGVRARADSMVDLSLPAPPVSLPDVRSFESQASLSGSDELVLGSAAPAPTQPQPQAVAATPEPSSVVLLATGLLGVTGTVLRRRKQGRVAALHHAAISGVGYVPDAPSAATT